ncbi:MAG TPA: DNA cytosine methyltransferase [Alphaproteobacteria bacterium]|nr:DNA cytosine methyltransferase [Alphaproteobacteria bacterium]
MFNFYEFFAGGGMARMGLGPDWRCLFANDFDHKKSRVYRENWGDDSLVTADIRSIKASGLPDQSDLAWASFPCQDLSLAGGGAGLKGDRSGMFWPFWELMHALGKEGRAPRIIAIENVCGTLTSHGGKDFAAICTSFEKSGYRCGAVIIDAALFVPQSRPRLFIIAVRNDVDVPPGLIGHDPSPLWHTNALGKAYGELPPPTKKNWIWWAMPAPQMRNTCFEDIIEERPSDVHWHSIDETQQLVAMMSAANIAKLEKAKVVNGRVVGTIYKRTRPDENGRKVQRAEVRFDNIAGCLRTPGGGSSRQLIMVIKGNSVKSRLISSRETARLMGLPDEYELPANYNEAYHLTGDGVVVPVVRHLAEHIFEPILLHRSSHLRSAA